MGHARFFVSYRRGDTAGRAGRLVDSLVDRFGRDAVFHDVGSIAPGERFMDRIGAAIAQVDVLFAVIGPGWIASGSAGRRLDEVDDPVRLELEAALAAGRRIVPVLVDRASMPAAGDLPPSIAELAATNACEVRDESWAADVQRMLLALGVVRAPLAVSRRRLLVASGGIAVAVASGVTIWRRSAGDSPRVESAGDWYPFRDAMSYGSLPTTSPEPKPVGIQTLEYRDPGDELDLELRAWWIEADERQVVVQFTVTALNAGGVSLDPTVLKLLVDKVPYDGTGFRYWQGRLGLGQGDSVDVAFQFDDITADESPLAVGIAADVQSRLVLRE